MTKFWTALILTNIAVVLLFIGVLTTASSVRTSNDPHNVTALPVPGKDAVVDYRKINESIDQKIATVAAPALEPVDYSSIQSYVRSAVKEEVAKLPPAPQGPRGEQGNTVLPIEISQDLVTSSVKWRCIGDTIWSTLRDKPIVGGVCQ